MNPLYYWIYIALIGAGFVTGRRRHWKNKALRPVVILLGMTCCSETLSWLLGRFVYNNLPVYHIYHPLQILLWAMFFYQSLRNRWRRVIPVTAILLLLFALANTTLLQPPSVFPANLIKIESVILLSWSFCLFWEFLDRPASENIFKQSSFIICVSLLWFNLVSYLFFELYYYYFISSELRLSIWRIHLFSNYTYYSLLLAAMFLTAEPSSND